MRSFLGFSSFLIIFFFSGCSVLTPVRVIEKDHSQLNLSIGGPFVPSSTKTAIVPYTTFGYAYGLKEDLTFSGNVHLLSAIFKTPGIDIGLVYQVVKEDAYIPELSIYPKLYFFKSLRKDGGFRMFPSLALNVSYTIWKHHLIYLGTDYLFQLTQGDYFVTPFLGYQFPVSHRIKLQTELKWMASNADSRHGVFEGESSISGHGTVGIFVGVNYGL